MRIYIVKSNVCVTIVFSHANLQRPASCHHLTFNQSLKAPKHLGRSASTLRFNTWLFFDFVDQIVFANMVNKYMVSQFFLFLHNSPAPSSYTIERRKRRYSIFIDRVRGISFSNEIILLQSYLHRCVKFS